MSPSRTISSLAPSSPAAGTTRSLNRRPVEGAKAAAIARRYFLDGRTKSEIATEYKLSRFKVARLLEWAMQVGLVKVDIAGPSELDLPLGDALERQFGLEAAVVLKGPELPDSAVPSHLGPLLALVLAELVGPGDVLGVGWGRTLEAAVSALPPLPNCPVVQLIGGVSSEAVAVNSSDLARRFAEQTGGSAFQLHSPFIVADAETANALRAEPIVAATMDQFPKVTIAVLGVGSWDPPMSGFLDSLPGRERAALTTQGVVADFCALLLDAAGRTVLPDIEARTVAMSRNQLSNVPKVIAAAGGASKSRALLAVIRSQLAKVVVTDAAAAIGILGTADDAW